MSQGITKRFVSYEDFAFEIQYFCQCVGCGGLDIVFAWKMRDDQDASNLFFGYDTKFWLRASTCVDTGDVGGIDTAGGELCVDLRWNAFVVLHTLLHTAVAHEAFHKNMKRKKIEILDLTKNQTKPFVNELQNYTLLNLHKI